VAALRCATKWAVLALDVGAVGDRSQTLFNELTWPKFVATTPYPQMRRP
jgi:hypothetical protein